MEKPYMVEQVIKYSDGTETVISYKQSQSMSEHEIVSNESVEEAVVEQVEEAVVAPEIAEEAIAESVEEAA